MNFFLILKKKIQSFGETSNIPPDIIKNLKDQGPEYLGQIGERLDQGLLAAVSGGSRPRNLEFNDLDNDEVIE